MFNLAIKYCSGETTIKLSERECVVYHASFAGLQTSGIIIVKEERVEVPGQTEQTERQRKHPRVCHSRQFERPIPHVRFVAGDWKGGMNATTLRFCRLGDRVDSLDRVCCKRRVNMRAALTWSPIAFWKGMGSCEVVI